MSQILNQQTQHKMGRCLTPCSTRCDAYWTHKETLLHKNKSALLNSQELYTGVVYSFFVNILYLFYFYFFRVSSPPKRTLLMLLADRKRERYL